MSSVESIQVSKHTFGTSNRLSVKNKYKYSDESLSINESRANLRATRQPKQNRRVYNKT